MSGKDPAIKSRVAISDQEFHFIKTRFLIIWAAAAIAFFQLAYCFSQLSLLIFAYLICLIQLARAPSARQAFYFSFGIVLFNAGFQLICFWTIFGIAAVALWCILAFWTGLFVALARTSLIRFGRVLGCVLIPFLWIGLEYFRSELYYLRFSWLNTGYALSYSQVPEMFSWFGMYGVGFLAMLAAVVLTFCFQGRRTFLIIFLGPLALLILLLFSQGFPPRSSARSESTIEVAGMQMEFPTLPEVIKGLNKLIEKRPEAQLLVLSEYTFDGEVPSEVKAWCRENRRYLIVGGKEPASGNKFYNTAFVINPEGEIAFRQGKSVPIQFFKDGLPAPSQQLWSSPWGKIGLCICYDLSYTRVTDKLVRLGAQALIVPTMDVADWGRRQHELHARVAPVRAAEYRVPIFRVASSGISQCTDHFGQVLAKTEFPGERKIIFGRLPLAKRGGTLPLDRWLAPFAFAITLIFTILLLALQYPRISRFLTKPQRFNFGSDGARHSCRFIELFVSAAHCKWTHLSLTQVKRHECYAPSGEI